MTEGNGWEPMGFLAEDPEQVAAAVESFRRNEIASALGRAFDDIAIGSDVAEVTATPPLVWKTNSVTLMVSNQMLYDAGVLKDPVHHAYMWPHIDPTPRLTRALAIYREGRRRLTLARLALTDPDALEDEEEW